MYNVLVDCASGGNEYSFLISYVPQLYSKLKNCYILSLYFW